MRSTTNTYCRTSPSLYLQLMGTATVSDQCTTIGSILTSPIITVTPGGLSTLRPKAGAYYANNGAGGLDNFTVGEIWSDPSAQGLNPEDIKPLNIRDLACPTWGLGLSTSANGDIITTIGPPWLPLILPPMEIFSLDSKWASECTGFWSDFWTLTTLFLFDPPIALTPAPLFAPTPLALSVPADPTTVSERHSDPAKSAKPASVPTDPAASPAKTGDPGNHSPVVTSTEPSPVPESSAASPKGAGNSLPDPKAPSDPVDPGDPQVKSKISSSSDPDPPSGDSQNPLIDPGVSIVGESPQEGAPSTHVEGLGAIIYNAFGKPGLEVAESSTVLSPSHSDAPVIGSRTVSLLVPLEMPLTQAYTVANQVFTPNPTAFSIADTTLSASGPAVMISNTIISLDQNGALKIDSSAISLLTPSDPSFTRAYVIAGETFTPNPSLFTIASMTISAGGPPVTINGTPIRLLPSGTLLLESSTIPLLPPQISSHDITIDGLDIKAQKSAFVVVDGVTVSAAAAAIAISGTRVSLEAGAETVDVGTGRFAAATTATNGHGVQAFTGGQGRGSQVAVRLFCWVIVLWVWCG